VFLVVKIRLTELVLLSVNTTVDVRKSVGDVHFTGTSVGNGHSKTLSTGRGHTTGIYHWLVELCYHGDQFYCVPRGPLQTQLNAVRLRCRISKCVLFGPPYYTINLRE